ncbi:hypothetical protein [Pedobacter xixiisoli]|nr:hypothetical protein [Pedobacter xixiisoli]
MRRIDKIIVYSVFIVPVVLLFSFAIFNAIFGKSTQELIIEDNLSEHFHGTVDTLYRERNNHNTKYAEISDGYKYAISTLWERFIDVNDSLSKDSLSFKVYIYKPSGDTIILNYKDTYKK